MSTSILTKLAAAELDAESVIVELHQHYNRLAETLEAGDQSLEADFIRNVAKHLELARGNLIAAEMVAEEFNR